MAIITRAARRDLVRLIERVNVDRTEVEIVSKHGSAVLMSTRIVECQWNSNSAHPLTSGS